MESTKLTNVGAHRSTRRNGTAAPPYGSLSLDVRNEANSDATESLPNSPTFHPFSLVFFDLHAHARVRQEHRLLWSYTIQSGISPPFCT